MPHYFAQTKYKSFQRQLNIYGFRRIHHGPNKGGYTHVHFDRQGADLSKIVRVGHHQRQDSSSDTSTVLKDCQDLLPKAEPSSFPISLDAVFSSTSNVDEDLFFNLFHPVEDDSIEDELDSLQAELEGNTAIEEAFELLSSETGEDEPIIAEQTFDMGDDQEELQQTSFPWKLHLMLEHADSKGFGHVVSWISWNSFKVHKPKEFVAQILPNYFDQTKFESFRRQLNLYGFARISRGPSRGVITHTSFVKGQRHLCKNIIRNQS